jgi:hypothetical protein
MLRSSQSQREGSSRTHRPGLGLGLLGFALWSALGLGACGPLLGLDEDRGRIEDEGTPGPCACEDDNPCTSDSCDDDGTCRHSPIAEGDALEQTDGDCHRQVCSLGVPQEVVDDGDEPLAEDCLTWSCSDGAPIGTARQRGVSCEVRADDDGFCDGVGVCRECLEDEHCAGNDRCGGGGETGVCGCTPHTCSQLGLTCGLVGDGCTGVLVCNNGFEDGEETDVDCGGVSDSCHERCGDGRGCLAALDCQSGFCGGGSCTQPWSGTLGGAGSDFATAIAATESGGAALVGTFSGTLAIGGVVLTSPAGATAGFALVVSASGATVDGIVLPNKTPRDVAVDHAGNILVGGSLTEEGVTRAFVDKLDATAKLLWSLPLEGAGASAATGVAIDAGGNAAVVGELDGTLALENADLTLSGTEDVFVLELDSAGAALRSQTITSIGPLRSPDVASGPSDALAIAVDFTGALDLNASPSFVSDDWDILVVLLDGERDVAATQVYGGPGAQQRAGIAYDGSGRLFLAGTFFGTLWAGSSQIPSLGDSDVFVARIDAQNATPVWINRYGDAFHQHIAAVAPDSRGGVVIAGGFTGTIDLAAPVLASAGGLDAFFGEIDANGSVRRARRFGDASAQNAAAVAITPHGAVLVAGDFRGSIDLGQGPAVSHGAEDIFFGGL